MKDGNPASGFMPGLIAGATTHFSQAGGRRGETGPVMEKQG